MKIVSVIFFLLVGSTSVVSQRVTLDEARSLYPKSTYDKVICEKLFAMLSVRESNNNNILSGYQGAVAANWANHQKEPAQKIKFFNMGRKLLEKAIISEPDNLELRFLRFTIQTNCPKAVQYDKNIVDDKEYIIKHLEDINNSELKKRIANYLLSSKKFNDSEKEKIKLILKME